MSDILNIAGRIHSISEEGIVTTASEIKDEGVNKRQSTINAEVQSELGNQSAAIDALENQNYVNISATNADTTIEDVFTRLGITPSADTIYRVANWKYDATTKYNTSYFSEYSVNISGSTVTYVPLMVVNVGIDSTPTPGSENLVQSGGVITYDNRIALNRRYIEGDDNTYKSTAIRGLIEGRIYRIEFKNPQWARTNIPSESLFLIRVLLNDANNTTIVSIVEILANSSRLLEKSYIFKVPANVEYLHVGGRADVGELIDFSLFDVTDLFAIDSNQQNGMQSKKTEVFIEPITEHGNVTYVGQGSTPIYKYIRFKYNHSYKLEFPVTDFDRTGVSSSQSVCSIFDGTNDILRITGSDVIQPSYTFTPTSEVDYYCLTLRAAVGESVTLFITDNTLEEELIEDNYTADFSISDENNYDIVRFSGGHIITKNFDSSKTPSVDNTESASDLDVTDGNGKVIMSLKDGNIQTKYFDSSKLSLPPKPYSRRIFFNTYVNTRNFLEGNFTPEAINNYEDGTFYKDNCVLYLPQTYTQNRDKTKLIIYCKHGSSTIEEDSDDILTNTMGKIFRYMLKLGYAILAADGVPNGWIDAIKISERVCGNYVAVQSTIKAYNYVINNYNIDANGAMIFGWSQGGAYALNVIENTDIPICGAALLSPVVSLRYHLWDVGSTVTIDGVTYTEAARLSIARIFDFPAFTTNAELLALEYDYTKTQGFEPWFKNVENMYEGFTKEGTLWKLPSGTTLDDIQMKKHLRCPIKVWCAVNDETLSCDVMEVFVKALKNAGVSCDISVKSTGGHNIPNNQSSIGSFTENGQSVYLYPIAKDIALWFNINGGYKL